MLAIPTSSSPIRSAKTASIRRESGNRRNRFGMVLQTKNFSCQHVPHNRKQQRTQHNSKQRAAPAAIAASPTAQLRFEAVRDREALVGRPTWIMRLTLYGRRDQLAKSLAGHEVFTGLIRLSPMLSAVRAHGFCLIVAKVPHSAAYAAENSWDVHTLVRWTRHNGRLV